MPVHTFSSRDFTRDVSAAKRAAAQGPVFITDRGHPAFALLRIDEYHRLTNHNESSLLDVMDGIPSAESIDFEPPRLNMYVQAASFDWEFGMFVLDTHVVSELRHGKPQQSADVRAWAAGQASSKFFLSAITLLELEIGIFALERRVPPQGSALRAWLTGVRAAFAGRILPFTHFTALVCAALHVPNPRSERDAMIAATAIEHGFSVVTRNVADFAHTGVEFINPWQV